MVRDCGIERRLGRIPAASASQLAKWELLDLYLADDEFSAEFSRLRQIHISVLSCIFKTQFGPEDGPKTTLDEYHEKLIQLLEKDTPDIR